MEILHSKILGSGQPLCILHGFLGMADNWKSLGNRYATSGFEVHLIDQRNHGRSFWSEDFNYSLMAQDLKAYQDYHGIQSANILGHSMGGKTAMQFACDFPERVEKLLIADIAPKYYPPHHQQIIDALLKVPLEELSSRGEADKQLALHLSDWGIRQFLLKSLYWMEPGKLGFRFNLQVLRHKMEEIGEEAGGGCLFGSQSLFVRGDRSEYIADADIPMIRMYFPDAEVETIDKAGHWLHAENPEQFFQVTQKFLNS
ncbi:alpha/beta fold hydrolase [Poritiphilus flavus]|uniref:Alpha/beta fold hydrolase n=1 Tax=Poritiphilus flavus TaxID=2697053 RepID=A0A6L9EGZ9_9FLAO|nr:alpha/beta fold hydrolase [Poritiphilus flavus]NAS13916.1 alpha/beta fold hydrolase [Poritiphilus flavus]